MTESQAGLYHRIEVFEFDALGANYTFAQRLAKENRWSPAFAARAIVEYRRFVFLYVAAEHPVSPPEVVDQVWHLHLLYTESYWHDFCETVLGRRLHHEPSRGGAEERAKFGEWYKLTVESYRRYFGNPPADIWPVSVPSQKIATPVINAPDGDQKKAFFPDRPLEFFATGLLPVTLLIVFVITVGIIISWVFSRDGSFEGWNILNFEGRKFLGFFGLIFVAALALALLIRTGIPVRTQRPVATDELNCYEIAYLNGGSKRVVDVAIASLYGRGCLDAATDGTVRCTSPYKMPGTKDFDTIERTVIGVVGNGRPGISRVRDKSAHIAIPIMQRLMQSGLIVSDLKNVMRIAGSLMVVLAVPAIGAVKIGVGMERKRPVGFLTVACIISLVLSVVVFARRCHRTPLGNATLAAIKLKYRKVAKANTLEANELVTVFSVWGASVLTGQEWSKLRYALTYKRPSQDWSGGGDSGSGGSSCGGSSCGGGGGCGGCSS